MEKHEEKSYDTVVSWFAGQMLNKLIENRHRGSSWLDTYDDVLIERLEEEVEELKLAIQNRDGTISSAEEIIREAADVANFAMMIANKKQAFFEPLLDGADHDH